MDANDEEPLSYDQRCVVKMDRFISFGTSLQEDVAKVLEEYSERAWRDVERAAIDTAQQAVRDIHIHLGIAEDGTVEVTATNHEIDATTAASLLDLIRDELRHGERDKIIPALRALLRQIDEERLADAEAKLSEAQQLR